MAATTKLVKTVTLEMEFCKNILKGSVKEFRPNTNKKINPEISIPEIKTVLVLPLFMFVTTRPESLVVTSKKV
jgi:hypothetical protein